MLKLNRFEICKKISGNLQLKLKSFHVFNDNKGMNILFITNEDKAYGFGSNFCGVCGLGHDNEVNEPKEIPELNKKYIKKFIIEYNFGLGLSNDGVLYGWGGNMFGQLGRGFCSDFKVFLKPQPIFFINKVIEVSCGSSRSLALASDGCIYGWGYNFGGHIGIGKEMECAIPTPTLIEISYPIQSVYCCVCSSFALTTDGLIYSWGMNQNYQLGHDNCSLIVYKPRLVDIINVSYVCTTYYNTYFLTNENNIYICGKYIENNINFVQKVPILLKSEKGFTSIHSLNYFNNIYIVSTVSGKTVYTLNGNQILRTEYQSVFDFYCDKYGITFETINVNKNLKLNKHENIPNKEKSHLDEDLYFQPKIDSKNLKVKNHFLNFITAIGSGGFGSVNKYFNTLDKQYYAVKCIKILETDKEIQQNVIKEAETIAQLKSHYVVQYNTSWIENNTLYIQMELCFDNLRNILNIKPKAFERSDDTIMNCIEYYISCEIFRQITEALNYLHSFKHNPIIHRDLKPENILIGNENNRMICKLADFGLSKITRLNSDFHTTIDATLGYMAPELIENNRYDTKIDIWSLGIIGSELFELNKFEKTKIDKDKISNLILQCSNTISTKLVNIIRQNRITCRELLIEIKSWLNEIKINKNLLQIYINEFDKREYCYFSDILKDCPNNNY